MAFYVLPDGAGILTHIPANGDAHRMFASMLGASRHPDAPPVTAIRKIERVAVYDGAQVLANNWKLTDLEPVKFITKVELEV